MSRLNFKNIKVKNLVGVIVGALLSSIALKLFVQRAGLVPAGVVGLATLIQKEFAAFFNVSLSYGVIYFILNAIIVLFVFRKIGKQFVILSFVNVIASSIFVEIIPDFVVTNDVILLTVFGGVLNGIGITLALKSGGSSGGADFIAVYYSTVKNRPMWDKIMLFNFVMLVYNGYRYDWTLSFYSIIYQFASTEILSNYHDRYKLSSLRIITELPDEISDAMLKVMRHGITKFDGFGMYQKRERYMLYTVVNSFEIKEVIKAIKTTDPKAFIEVSNVDRIEGNFRQKPLD